jgi:hypothetical protein
MLGMEAGVWARRVPTRPLFFLEGLGKVLQATLRTGAQVMILLRRFEERHWQLLRLRWQEQEDLFNNNKQVACHL